MRQLRHQPIRNSIYIYCFISSIVISIRLINDSKFILNLKYNILIYFSRTLFRNIFRQILISSAEALAQSFATIFFSIIAGIDYSDSSTRFINNNWFISVLSSSINKINIIRASKIQLQ